jgi:hypothetical protein
MKPIKRLTHHLRCGGLYSFVFVAEAADGQIFRVEDTIGYNEISDWTNAGMYIESRIERAWMKLGRMLFKSEPKPPQSQRRFLWGD